MIASQLVILNRGLSTEPASAADADRYVSRIFGENHYSIVDNVERLPERLPNVFAALTA